ncbi:uncharacterized protein LOC142226658 [Haematobia irritans]|uniref:uncharacterized protein LOC142226658 n=1 Tax=Haematobia irritans TaxID=7368 RepID=UPI003F50B430
METYNKTNDEIEVLEKLKFRLSRQLRMENAALLASNFCASNTDKLKNEIQSLLEEYGRKMASDILHDALVEAVYCKKPSQLVVLLESLYNDDELKTFEIMLELQIEIFYISQQILTDKDYHLEIALVLHTSQEDKNYGSISLNVKKHIDNIIAKLPNNLKYLFFNSHFCLMNNEYSEYLYTAVNARNLDSSSRYIWTWYDNLSIDTTGHVKAKRFGITEIHGERVLLVQLQGLVANIPFFMKEDSKLVAGWDLNGDPQNNIWTVEFLNNDLVALYQSDYIMCSTDDKSDRYRRKVRGYNSEKYNYTSKECQWYLGTCVRTKL